LEEVLDLFRSAPPDFAPGRQWKYSNSGYAVLAAIIERVGRMPYHKFLHDRIFEPLGMHRTWDGAQGDAGATPAHGYEVRGGTIRDARRMSLSHTCGSGGVFSTVDDLARWHRALAQGNLLSPALMREHVSPALLTSGERTEYALGWFVGELRGSPMLYHGGGIYGYVGHMVWLPDEDVFVALLTNCVDPAASPATHSIAERVAALAAGKPIVARERIGIDLEPARLERFAGSYRIEGPTGGVALRHIVLDGTSLFYDDGNGRRTRIQPESPTSFFAEGAAAHVSFEIARNGRVAAMTIHTGSGRRIRAAKVN
jgi:CubicO group peptidase (beta-lactamase class C family)